MRTVCVFGLAFLCVILGGGLAGAQDAEAPQVPPKTVGISFEQSADNVFFDFQVDTETYNRVYYNTTVRDGETLVKVVFHNEADPSTQKFVRLHLAQAVLPSDTSASTTQDGAKLTFSKANPGQRWSNVVNFASDEALSGTLPVNVAGNRVDITATEFQDVKDAIVRSLDRIEGIQYTPNDVDAIASQFGEAFDKSTPYCLAPSLCVCKPPFVFDGTKCVSADLWSDFQSLIVSQSAVQVQVEEDKPLRVLAEQELLQLDQGSFNAVFDTYQKRAARQQVWPYMLYSQTFKGSDVLVVGAGMTQFEPLVLANTGCNVTVVDTNINNLKLLNRIADASDVDRANLHLVYAPTLDGLGELSGNFDVVMALDSLTRAPTELLEGAYEVLLSKLRVGGRWIQLAPSKSRYLAEGSPSYADFARIYNRHLGVPEEKVWYEWLDLRKLMKILGRTRTKFQIVFEGELGSNPAQFPDNFQLIDLLYLGGSGEGR